MPRCGQAVQLYVRYGDGRGRGRGHCEKVRRRADIGLDGPAVPRRALPGHRPSRLRGKKAVISEMIDNVGLRLNITALFCVSTAECPYVLVAQRSRWRSAVDNLLHLVMSLAMIVLAWSAGTDLRG